MDVAVDLRFIVPIGMSVLFDGQPLGQNVFQMSFPSVPALVGGKAIEHRLVGGFLQVHVERGVNLQPALMDLVSAVLPLQVAANLFDKVRSERIRIVRQMENNWSAAGVSCLGGG